MSTALQDNLKQLRLSGIIDNLDIRLQEARSNQLDYSEFLELLIQDELGVRGDRRLTRMLKAAGFVNLAVSPDFSTTG